MKKTKWMAFLFAAVTLALTFIPVFTYAAEATPAYQSLDELSGKRFAYVNGSVYNKSVQDRIEGTTEEFYPSLSECVAAVEAGKADAAVQLSYCCQLAVNRRPGTVALLPEPVAEVSEGFFFPHGSELTSSLLLPLAEEHGIADPHIAYELSVAEGDDEADLLVDLRKFAASGIDEHKVVAASDDVTRQILGNVIQRHYVDDSGMLHLILG